MEAAGLLLPEVYLRWRGATDEPSSAAAARLESEQLDTGGAQYDDGGSTSEVIYSSSGEGRDFGDRKSACGRKKNPSEQGDDSWSRTAGLFLVSTIADMRLDQVYLCWFSFVR